MLRSLATTNYENQVDAKQIYICFLPKFRKNIQNNSFLYPGLTVKNVENIFGPINVQTASRSHKRYYLLKTFKFCKKKLSMSLTSLLQGTCHVNYLSVWPRVVVEHVIVAQNRDQ